ncbi:MAG: hypothetical protein LCH79_02935 [Proteobacteria bacterium]|nr:hypothetical protein [Pseudomonadota bacterium]
MSARVPHHALELGADLALQIAKYGWKRGLKKAGAKANPALMVLEAVASVATAIESYVNYRASVADLDGLRKLLPLERERLRLEREELTLQLKVARAELEQNKDMQKRLEALVIICVNATRQAWADLDAMRQQDLPKLEEFDSHADRLDASWQKFQRALGIYKESIN